MLRITLRARNDLYQPALKRRELEATLCIQTLYEYNYNVAKEVKSALISLVKPDRSSGLLVYDRFTEKKTII